MLFLINQLFKNALITKNDKFFLLFLRILIKKFGHYPDFFNNILIILIQLTNRIKYNNLILIASEIHLEDLRIIFEIYRGKLSSSYLRIINANYLIFLANLSEISHFDPEFYKSSAGMNFDQLNLKHSFNPNSTIDEINNNKNIKNENKNQKNLVSNNSINKINLPSESLIIENIDLVNKTIEEILFALNIDFKLFFYKDKSKSNINNEMKSISKRTSIGSTLNTIYPKKYLIFKEKKKIFIEIHEIITRIGYNITTNIEYTFSLINSYFYTDIISFLIYVTNTRNFFDIVSMQNQNKKDSLDLKHLLTSIIENSILILFNLMNCTKFDKNFSIEGIVILYIISLI